MGRKKLTYGYASNIPILCSICGDKARGNNFDVLSCISCKSFFRRHGLLDTENLPCRYQGLCVISKETRSSCLPCRLKKCIESGMDPLKIRGSTESQMSSKEVQQSITTNERKLQLWMPKPLNLLQNDCSTLTSDQWNLLSNIIRSFDEQNIINQVKIILDQKSSLPLKLRLKPEDTLKLHSIPIQAILPLIERSPHLHSLSKSARRALALHNAFQTGGFSACLVARDTGAFHNPTHMTACSIIHESDFLVRCAKDNEQLVQNGNLIKLMLFVLIFSSNCSLVMFNTEEDLETMSCSIELVHLQNIYATMLWKYLVHLYGGDGAVIHFTTLVKNVTDTLIRAAESVEHMGRKILVDRIIVQTKRWLVIED